MTADELAAAVIGSIARACISDDMDAGDIPSIARSAVDAARRITGIGQEQYQVAPHEQRFESYALPEMLTGLREELLDVINYAVMTDILVQRKLDALAGGDGNAGHPRLDGDPPAPPAPIDVAESIRVACAAATEETLAAMFPEGGRYGVRATVDHTIGVDLYNLVADAPDFDADGTDAEACQDAGDAPREPREPLFGLTFTIDSIQRHSHYSESGYDAWLHTTEKAGFYEEKRIGFHVDHSWEAPVGEQYVLIPKSAWETL